MSVTFVAAETEKVKNAFELNVSNTNAAHLLSALGLETGELCGETEGEEFLGRVLMVLGFNRVGEAGIRLETLHKLAQEAAARGLWVRWS